jgi:SAM-dependent methyltransferase
MHTITDRKILEAEFHDKLRDPALRENPELYAKLTANNKWYTITKKSREFAETYLRQHSPGSSALDFACGDGETSLLMAEAGAEVVGVDISPVSIANAERKAASRGVKAQFKVMDCEAMTFPDRTFDLISVNGVLHHLELGLAYSELARVLKPTGSILCVEALAHNPVFHAYRKLTPHLRTKFEARHILHRRDVLTARQFFKRIEWRFFHMVNLAAVPFRHSRVFVPTLATLDVIDSVLLSISPIRWWAWQIGFVLSEPKHLRRV